MRITRWMWTLGVPAVIAGCATGDEPKLGKADLPIFSTESIQAHLSGEGIIDFGTTVFGTNPTTLLEPLDFHRYEFQAAAVAQFADRAVCLSRRAPRVHQLER